MQKTYIAPDYLSSVSSPTLACYTSDEIALVAVSSEAAGWPVENLFSQGSEGGWRAREPGKQIIRVTFEQPASIRQIHLVFRESALARTQEFSLAWFGASGDHRQELIRQQWNFSPAGSNKEIETLEVQLTNVAALELTIVPDIAGGNAVASVEAFVISR